eukprot:CAMPEP_0172364800 /NCGR_PEP_ID=MMETSP1060-20121228/7850_1 /TAXON_ID=37318 /ORGANISM="Pseudo-nitzschia pungens, Strain cf. cingulata" /LENGTH=32 /DNA_ID= /DNA_START= /DNA_END= /DNA_ORIENTATION=
MTTFDIQVDKANITDKNNKAVQLYRTGDFWNA